MRRSTLVAPLLVATLALPVLTAPARAADEPAAIATTLTLKVVDENGWPLKGVRVESEYDERDRACEECGTVPREAQRTTGAKGTATFVLGLREQTNVRFTLDDSHYGRSGERSFSVRNLAPGAAPKTHTVKFRVLAKPGKAKTAIKTSSKAAVKKAYRAQYRKQVRNERPVKVKGCTVSKTPVSLQRRELRAINFFRSMVGVEKARLDTKLSAKASKAAVIQMRQGYLDHYPRKGKCWTKTGYQASGRSNLSYGLIGAENMKGYMDDPGYSNVAAGHRSWILTPVLSRVGTGYAADFNAMWVVNDGDWNRTAASPTWIAWPSAGYFPTRLEPYSRWSFHTPRTDVDFRKAKVKVTAGGKTVKQRIVSRDAGYGYLNGVVFDIRTLPKAAKKGGTVKVTISGMRLRDSTKLPAYSYAVKFFKA